MVVPHQKRQRTNSSVEFKRALVQRSIQPNINVAQLTRENGVNDNLLFNWWRQYLNEQSKSSPDTSVTLMPVEIAEPRHDTPLPPTLAEPGNTLCCEVVLPAWYD
jgi:transposase